MENLSVSRNTIKNDLDDVYKILEKNNIEAKEQKIVNVNEMTIRKFLINHYKIDIWC